MYFLTSTGTANVIRAELALLQIDIGTSFLSVAEGGEADFTASTTGLVFMLGGAAGLKLYKYLSKKSKGSSKALKQLPDVPGRVQSRINLQTGTNKFGMKHIVREHLSGKTNKSQFNMTEDELRILLQSHRVVGSPVVKTVQSATHGTLYVRQVDVGRTVGTNYLKNNRSTSVLTTQSDKYGNIVTAFPGL